MRLRLRCAARSSRAPAEVRREIEQSTGRQVSRSAFYTTLDRLERKGYVEWTEEAPQDSRRTAPLRLFGVTPEGIDALRVTRAALRTLSRDLDAVLGDR